jgi:GNAT superfamily N-acetyltransferase
MVWREERTCDGKARHTQELTLEQPTERALSAAAKLVGKTWYPDEPAKWDGLCEKIELAHHLEHATYVRAAMLGDRFAGIVAAGPAQSEAGTARADAGALWYRNHMRAYAPWVLGTPDEPRIGLALVPITAEIALTQELVERGDARSAWEITLLVVDPACHGHGIGRTLFSGALDYLRAQSAPGFFLATDDGCDFGFYDHLGLERIVSREAAVCRETPRRDNATATNKTGDVPFCAYLYGAWLGDKDDAH